MLFLVDFDECVEFTFLGLGFVKKPFLNPPNVLLLSEPLRVLANKDKENTSQILRTEKD